MKITRNSRHSAIRRFSHIAVYPVISSLLAASVFLAVFTGCQSSADQSRQPDDLSSKLESLPMPDEDNRPSEESQSSMPLLPNEESWSYVSGDQMISSEVSNFVDSTNITIKNPLAFYCVITVVDGYLESTEGYQTHKLFLEDSSSFQYSVTPQMEADRISVEFYDEYRRSIGASGAIVEYDEGSKLYSLIALG